MARCEANETVIDDMEQVKDILRKQIVEEVSGRSSTIVDLSYLPILGSFLLGYGSTLLSYAIIFYLINSRFAFEG